METQTNITIEPARFNIGYFFLSGGVLVALITTVVSFLNLVFETLNKRFPDTFNASYQYGYSSWEYESLRTALATLIIVFPVFLVLTYVWEKLSKNELLRWDVFVRRWLVNIILFLSALVVMIDLITLVRYFISGEITSRFVYKVLTVLVVAGIVGFYYTSHVREKRIANLYLILGAVATVLVVGAICYSFAVIGSPQKQRQLRLDDRRVTDLQGIQSQVIYYWQQKEKLPADLKELIDPISGWSLPVDPEFEKGNTYEYSIKGPLAFELCATFSLPMPKGWSEYGGGGMWPVKPYYDMGMPASSPYPGYGANESWDHEAGRTCFLRTIDKELYPPFPKDQNIVY